MNLHTLRVEQPTYHKKGGGGGEDLKFTTTLQSISFTQLSNFPSVDRGGGRFDFLLFNLQFDRALTPTSRGRFDKINEPQTQLLATLYFSKWLWKRFPHSFSPFPSVFISIPSHWKHRAVSA